MSESEESPENTAVDERLLALVDRLAVGDETVAEPVADPAREAERRAALELLALLPAALDPRPAPADLPGRIVDGEAPAAASPQVVRHQPRPARRAPRWALPLAAGLAGVLLGLAGWQQQVLDGQRRTIAELRSGLAQAEADRGRLQQLEETVSEQSSKLAMMTRPGAEISLLKPVGSEPLYPTARATVVASPEGGSWFMRADGLGPCPLGRTYKVWFMVDGRTVAGPTFLVKQPGDEIEIASEDLPPGLEAIKITLEFEPETPIPTGPEILLTDRAMRLL